MLLQKLNQFIIPADISKAAGWRTVLDCLNVTTTINSFYTGTTQQLAYNVK